MTQGVFCEVGFKGRLLARQVSEAELRGTAFGKVESREIFYDGCFLWWYGRGL